MSDLLDLAGHGHNLGGIMHAGKHQEGHRADPKRFKDIVNATQHWEYKEQPTPGASAYAYESLALPEFGIVDSGIGPSFFFRPTSKPSYQFNKSIPITGLGGIIAGTVVSQPLYDPATNTWGGAEFTS